MKDGFGVEHVAKAVHHHHTRTLLKEIVGEFAGQGYSTTKRRAKKSRVSKAKLPRIKRLTWNQPHDNDAADTIIHNGRALKDPDERMQAHTQMNNANRIPKFFSPYRVREIPASGGAIPLQPTGKGARRSDTVFVERKHLYEIPAVQAGSGVMAAGAVGGGVYALHRKSKVSKIAPYGKQVFHGTTQRQAAQIIGHGFKPSKSFGFDQRGAQIYSTDHPLLASMWATKRPHGGYAGYKQRNGDDVPTKGTHQVFHNASRRPKKSKTKLVSKPLREQRERKVVLRAIATKPLKADPNTEHGFMTGRPSELKDTKLMWAAYKDPKPGHYQVTGTLNDRSNFLPHPKAKQ
jgi:hypothetical protein